LSGAPRDTDRDRPGPDRSALRVAAPGARPLALEGAFQALGQGLGETYLGAFALLLGAGGLTLGLVATLPTAATAAAQVLARRARARMGSARALLGRAWSAQALAYAALGLCLLVPYPWSVATLCAGASLAWGLAGVTVPAWTALVSVVVPPPRHGWFFGLRGSAQQLGMVAAILGGGAVLSWMTSRGREALGFACIFALAGVARSAGTALLARVPDPDRLPPERARAPGLRVPRASRKVRRLAFYLWALHLGTCVSTPFFVPYMLKDLRFTYAHVGLLIAVPATVKVVTLRLWGRLADRLGPGPVLRMTGWMVALVPALWLLSGSAWWILAAQVFSGIAWGGFELAQASSILQATRGREREVALFYAVDGGVLIAGSLIGGLTVDLFAGWRGSGYLAAMALSTALRLLPAASLLWRVRGIGKPPWSHLKIPLRVWAVRPTRGISFRVPDITDQAPAEGAPETKEGNLPADRGRSTNGTTARGG
jgi:MFS family permease